MTWAADSLLTIVVLILRQSHSVNEANIPTISIRASAEPPSFPPSRIEKECRELLEKYGLPIDSSTSTLHSFDTGDHLDSMRRTSSLPSVDSLYDAIEDFTTPTRRTGMPRNTLKSLNHNDDHDHGKYEWVAA